jgi:soluble lytic murein transglycosylase-like protein
MKRRIAIITSITFIVSAAVLTNASINTPEAQPVIIHTQKHHIADPLPYVPEKPSEQPQSKYTYYDVPLSDELQEYAEDLCREYSVDYRMVLSIMGVESEYQSDVISRTNDWGLMQINEANHKDLREELGITDFLDPKQNILAGVYILSQIAEKNQTVKEILMVYNCGQSGARRLWSRGIESTRYSRAVIERMEAL